MSYGVEVYGMTNKCNLDSLQIACNRVLLCLQYVKRNTPIKALYLNFKCLPVYSLYKFNLLKIAHNFFFKKSCIPNVIANLFTVNTSVHSYNTRSAYSFHMYHNNRYGSYISEISKYWNELNNILKTTSCFNTFCTLLKSNMFLSDF